MSEIILTEENFDEEVVKSALPVLADFWADWCGPCRMLAPVIAEIANELNGEVKVGKINVDEQPGLARQFGISSIPTVILFKNGVAAGSSVGFVPKENIMKLLQK